ncbi:MAG TPA: regulatory iron-sulfur-containing complex subunit RicT [Cytophaga sp.]|jgi:cell fate regulator YaaT (PSP1 superfamily)|nr:regulatory iron-sulfur-containing complex subunit RicT [Cytophaga sp.]
MSCSSGSCGTGGGCSTKTGGCSSGGCSSGGCNKLNSFDWLGNMELNSAPTFDIIEIRFKNGRKEFFRNSKSIELFAGDPVVVEVQSGHHIGYVSMQGEIVRLQMKKKNVLNNDDIKSIYRKASQKDLEKFEQAKNREASSLYRTREIIVDQKLGMKLSDVEFQADNTKVTFYYSAEDRVDFRELIKMLAGEFKVRIEMKQISLRHEAARLGGIGSCGRELCCSTWLTDFKNVNTSAARYQNLSLNPSKLSGQCGRLKCCLNYELDTYLDALKGIPELETPLKTEMGNATLQKTDIFKRIMWFGFQDETTWLPISVERVIEIIEMNKAGKIPATLESNEIVIKDDRIMIREKEELSRFDDKFKSKNKKKKKKRSTNDDATDRTQRPTVNVQRPDSDSQHTETNEKVHTITPRSERSNQPNNNNRPQQRSNPSSEKNNQERRNEPNVAKNNNRQNQADRPQRVSPNPEKRDEAPRNVNQGDDAHKQQSNQSNRPQRINQQTPNQNQGPKNEGQQGHARQNNQPNNNNPKQGQGNKSNQGQHKKQEHKGEGGKHQLTKKAMPDAPNQQPPDIKIPANNFRPRQNSDQHPTDGSTNNSEK